MGGRWIPGRSDISVGVHAGMVVGAHDEMGIGDAVVVADVPNP